MTKTATDAVPTQPRSSSDAVTQGLQAAPDVAVEHLQGVLARIALLLEPGDGYVERARRALLLAKRHAT